MDSSDTDNSDTDLERLRKEIEGLKEETKKTKMEGKYHFHLGVGLAFIAIGIGVQLSTAGVVGRIPTGIFAFLFYIIGGLQIIKALISRVDLKGFHKLLMNIGVGILLVGALMVSLPFFGVFTLPTWLINYGILVASFGFLLMEISIIRFHKNKN